jgi:antitoxin component YwqK of YwqJK toxin-antitoxin module
MLRKITIGLLFWVTAGALIAQNPADSNSYRVFYHANGQKSSEGYLINGKPDGWWKSYNDKGLLISEGNRKNFLLDSLWVFYDNEGKKTLEIHYKESKKYGERIHYFTDEYMVENWENDTLKGNVNIYNSLGWLKKTTPYEEGKPHGMEKEFNATGMVVSVAQYYRGILLRKEFINRTDNNGLKQGNWKFFHDNGNLQMEGTYLNDKKHGFFKYYDTTGQFLSVEKYENDRLIEDAPETKQLDTKTNYHPNGRPAITATYYKGVPEGIRREYDTAGQVIKGYLFENGVLRYEGITDLNGKRQGLWKEYYPTGELRAMGYYKNSAQINDWHFYFLDKTVEITGSYNAKGQKDGEWLWFYSSGDTLMIENWEAGELNGRFVEYDEAGIPVSTGEFVEGSEEGVWQYRNGGFKEEGSYFDGMRQGLWRAWYPDGVPASEIEYEQGVPNGKYIDFWENGNTKNSGRYITGARNGMWYKYDENGVLIFTTQYKNGKEIQWNNYRLDEGKE